MTERVNVNVNRGALRLRGQQSSLLISHCFWTKKVVVPLTMSPFTRQLNPLFLPFFCFLLGKFYFLLFTVVVTLVKRVVRAFGNTDICLEAKTKRFLVASMSWQCLDSSKKVFQCCYVFYLSKIINELIVRKVCKKIRRVCTIERE